MDRKPFTKAVLDRLTAAPGQRLTVLDARVPGLQLRVTPSGAKTFSVFRRTKGGSPERITIGRYPSMTIERARKRAAQINLAIEGGANPAKLKRAHKAELTFGELFEDFLERHSKPRKRTWPEDKAKFDQYLVKTLGPQKLSAIDVAQVAAVHSAISKVGHKVAANRVLALISSVYGWALSSGLWQTNPAKGVRKNAERSRERFLQAEELPRFYSALVDEPNTALRDYFLISLLTGARRANVLAMRWSELDMARFEWRIARTKNDDPQTIPLTPEAVKILQSRRTNTDSPFVFAGHGKHGHLVEPKMAWRRIFDRDELTQLTTQLAERGITFEAKRQERFAAVLARARAEAVAAKIDVSTVRMADLRIHDLRRTLGSWQARTGASLAIIGKSLNHKSVQTTATYARLDTDPVRESVERATSAILVAAGMKQAGEVTQLKKKRKRS